MIDIIASLIFLIFLVVGIILLLLWLGGVFDKPELIKGVDIPYGTYTQICTKCRTPHQFEFWGFTPSKHWCSNCKEFF
jgi:hypothetical protein